MTAQMKQLIDSTASLWLPAQSGCQTSMLRSGWKETPDQDPNFISVNANYNTM